MKSKYLRLSYIGVALLTGLLTACASVPLQQTQSMPSQVPFTQKTVQRYVVVGHTQKKEILFLYGEPDSVIRVGETIFLNYTQKYHEEGGITFQTLTFQLNRLDIVVDYDIQVKTF